MRPEELREFFIAKGLQPKLVSFITAVGDVKYKLGKNSLKKFKRYNGGWAKIWSAYYKDISINAETGKLHIEKFIR